MHHALCLSRMKSERKMQHEQHILSTSCRVQAAEWNSGLP